MGQKPLHQGFTHTLPPCCSRDVYPPQPADARPGIWIIGKTADGNQLPVAESAQKALTGLVESIGPAFPIRNQAREKPETFCNGLRFQFQDFRSKR